MYHLRPTAPYSFTLSLKRLLDMPRQVIGRVEPGPIYVRALDQGERLGLVSVSAEGEELVVDLEGDLAAEAALGSVRRAFSLDLDLSAFHRHMNDADPVMASIAQRYLGARPIAPFSLWESLAWAVIGQQVNVAFAFALKESLVRLAGRSYRSYPAFPTAERVAALEYEQLQAEKYSRRKAEYVIDLARAVAAGRLDLERIVALPFQEAVAELTKLRGVGRWTAECLLMDAGHPDAFPAADVGIQRALERFYGLDHRPSEAEVRAMGETWAPHRSLACFYLWLALLDRDGI